MSLESKPSGFEDLKPTELYRSALEDFALPVEAEDKNKKKVLLAAFLEGGVTWADYVDQHPEFKPEPEEAAEQELKSNLQSGTVITSNAPSHNSVEEGAVSVEPVVDDPAAVSAIAAPRVVVKEAISVTSQDKYLIKMTRKNPVFEIRGHRFTKNHPYALVDANDADYILTKEDGFRQATPSELNEFYG